MIAVKDTQIKFEHMGVFTGGAEWVHPSIATVTYELLFVHEGRVLIEEAGVRYTLLRGDYLLLSPHILHRGFAPSGERTVFTWLHFLAEGFEDLGIPKDGRCADVLRAEYRLRELGHFAKSRRESVFVEAELLSLLLSFKREANPVGSKLCEEAAEYIRVHIESCPSAAAVARHFSYSADHLSRLFKRETGLSLQEYINEARVSLLKRMLLSDTRSVKEIAAQTGFEDGNRLSKFFKYHTGKTPGEYRAGFFMVHTNIK